ncbi:MAG TPA: metal-dependent transcriptional regulator [Candidatus Paceibacterota bacterium]|jgi:DtxR family Mn-dependent transcriptional regulator
MSDSYEFRTTRGYEIIEHDSKLITSAMEDYLEMIYRATLACGLVRLNTLSRLLNVRPPSASKMISRLSKFGYINYTNHDLLEFTERGVKIAKYLYDRHIAVESFLNNLGMHQNTLTDTEKIEHNISDVLLERINLFNQYVQENPTFLKIFEEYTPKKDNI